MFKIHPAELSSLFPLVVLAWWCGSVLALGMLAVGPV